MIVVVDGIKLEISVFKEKLKEADEIESDQVAILRYFKDKAMPMSVRDIVKSGPRRFRLMKSGNVRSLLLSMEENGVIERCAFGSMKNHYRVRKDGR